MKKSGLTLLIQVNYVNRLLEIKLKDLSQVSLLAVLEEPIFALWMKMMYWVILLKNIKPGSILTQLMQEVFVYCLSLNTG